ECFLFPLLYDILDEKISNKKKGLDSTKAVRGLILYPLNALAEDQMRRLRKALSSEKVVKWLDSDLKEEHITFARYTSLTPTSGDRSKPGVKNRNKEALKNLNKDWESIKSFAKKGTSTDDDYLYVIPNRDVNIELCDRWTIQDSPPDLLITNYSMLNVMLMRDDENNIFDATKNWLQESEENVFH